MARYHRINLDGKSCTETRIVTADTLPGSVVFISSGEFAQYVTPGVVNNKLYILNTDYTNGKTSDDVVAADDAGIGEYAETGREMAVLVAAASVLVKDTPLTTALAGVLEIGTPGTDTIVAYSQEALTVGVGPELVRVRFA